MVKLNISFSSITKVKINPKFKLQEDQGLKPAREQSQAATK